MHDWKTRSNGDEEGGGAAEVGRDLVTQGLLGCVRELKISKMQDSSNFRAWVWGSD